MNKSIFLKTILITGLLFSQSLFLSGQDSLSLSLALEKALDYNYGIVIAKSEVNIASVNNNWGNAGRYPGIGLDIGSYNSYDINNVVDYSNFRLGASLGARWTLFDGFRIQITKDKLSQLEVLAKGQSAVIVESTIQDVILAYYTVLLNIEELVLINNVMTLSKDRFDYETRRFELGGTASYNVLQAKNIFLNDTAFFLEQEVRLRNSVRDFNFLIGEESSKMWIFTDKFEARKKPYLLSDLSEKMMAHNNNLQNQYTNLLLQQNEIRLEKGTYYPSVDLTTGLNNNWTVNQRVNADPVNLNNLNIYGNLLISFDIYNGGNRKRALEVARINEEIAQVEIDQMKHSLNNQLLNLHDYYYVLQALKGVAQESLETAELNMDIAGDKFRSGAINSFNYRDIQLIYFNSALQNLKATFNLINSESSLIRITGGFVSENE